MDSSFHFKNVLHLVDSSPESRNPYSYPHPSSYTVSMLPSLVRNSPMKKRGKDVPECTLYKKILNASIESEKSEPKSAGRYRSLSRKIRVIKNVEPKKLNVSEREIEKDKRCNGMIGSGINHGNENGNGNGIGNSKSAMELAKISFDPSDENSQKLFIKANEHTTKPKLVFSRNGIEGLHPEHTQFQIYKFKEYMNGMLERFQKQEKSLMNYQIKDKEMYNKLKEEVYQKTRPPRNVNDLSALSFNHTLKPTEIDIPYQNSSNPQKPEMIRSSSVDPSRSTKTSESTPEKSALESFFYPPIKRKDDEYSTSTLNSISNSNPSLFGCKLKPKGIHAKNMRILMNRQKMKNREKELRFLLYGRK